MLAQRGAVVLRLAFGVLARTNGKFNDFMEKARFWKVKSVASDLFLWSSFMSLGFSE